MIEPSIFVNDNEIIDFVHNIYNINVHTVSKLDRGSANIYILNHNEYILKEFQSKYTGAEINKEIIVINHLKDNGIPVPEYMITLEGKYGALYKDRIVIIQKYIQGDLLEQNCGTYEQTIECARMYGKIIVALKTLPLDLPNTDITSWYSKEAFLNGIQSHRDILSKLELSDDIDKKIYDDITYKISIIETLMNNYDFKDIKNISIENSHGDYNYLQFIYENGKIKAVIDFVSTCKISIIWELIRSYSYIDKDAKDGSFNLDTFIDYVKEFNKYYKLNRYDLEFMPYLYLVQIINSVYGYKHYVKDHSKTKLLNFAFYRTKLCKYLFDNAKNISDRLLKEIN